MENTIPVIDAEKISCEEGEFKKLREACERWGCFMADMKKVVEALVVTWDKMHSALYRTLGLYDLCSSQAMQIFCSQLDDSLHQRRVLVSFQF
ncbi:hypothetical protein JHK87_030373 [Glycine soja]|nr:hypothetical protein JHK87_030373 [Glycine soja]